MKEVGGEGKEGHACRQSPRFWKPAFASERSAWLARLVQQYWHVSIKGLFHTERSFMVSDTRFALHCKSIFFDLFWAKVALFYCHFLISCRVSFVLRCFYKGYSSFLCRGENCKTFCLAELWTCIKMRCGLKILDLNACHILPLQIQLSGSFELKLQNFTLVFNPFRRIKKTNEQSLHWSFGFIEISPLALSTQSKIQKKKLVILVSHTHGSSKVHFRSTEGQTFIGQWIMTADDSIKCQCANSGMTGQVGGFQNPGVCLQVSPSFPPHPLPVLLLAPFFAQQLTLIPQSLLKDKTQTLAKQAMRMSKEQEV